MASETKWERYDRYMENARAAQARQFEAERMAQQWRRMANAVADGRDAEARDGE